MAFLIAGLIAINNRLTQERISLENNLNNQNTINRNYNYSIADLRNQINRLNPYYTNEQNNLNKYKTSLTDKYNTLTTNLSGYNVIDKNVISLNDNYKNTVIPELQDQYSDSFKKKTASLLFYYLLILDENDKINNRYKYIKNQFTRHDQKYNYYSNSMSNMVFLNNILVYSFYILVLIFSGFLYLYVPDWSNYFKIFIHILA